MFLVHVQDRKWGDVIVPIKGLDNFVVTSFRGRRAERWHQRSKRHYGVTPNRT